MSLIIDHPDADRLAHELATRTGEPIDEAVIKALKERLARAHPKLTPEQERVRDRLLEIGRRSAARPVLDPRSPDEILGYDANGLPT